MSPPHPLLAPLMVAHCVDDQPKALVRSSRYRYWWCCFLTFVTIFKLKTHILKVRSLVAVMNFEFMSVGLIVSSLDSVHGDWVAYVVV